MFDMLSRVPVSRSSPGSVRCTVDEHDAASPERLLGQIDRAHADLGRAHERFLRLITEIDRHGVWANDGARDLAQWLWMRYGISDWKARRFIDAAAALPQLPAISDALSRGQLGVDKVIELTRFATFENEDGLIPWAQHVSAARIRHEADVARTPDTDEAASEDRSRSVTWSYRDEGRRFEMHADLPAVQGAAVARRSTASRLRSRRCRTRPVASTLPPAEPTPSSPCAR